MSKTTETDRSIWYELQLYFSAREVISEYPYNGKEPQKKYLKLFSKGESALKNITIDIDIIPYSIIKFYLMGGGENTLLFDINPKRSIYTRRNKLKTPEIRDLLHSISKLYKGLEIIDRFPPISQIELKGGKIWINHLPNETIPYESFEILVAIIEIGKHFLVENSVENRTWKA